MVEQLKVLQNKLNNNIGGIKINNYFYNFNCFELELHFDSSHNLTINRNLSRYSIKSILISAEMIAKSYNLIAPGISEYQAWIVYENPYILKIRAPLEVIYCFAHKICTNISHNI